MNAPSSDIQPAWVCHCWKNVPPITWNSPNQTNIAAPAPITANFFEAANSAGEYSRAHHMSQVPFANKAPAMNSQPIMTDSDSHSSVGLVMAGINELGYTVCSTLPRT